MSNVSDDLLLFLYGMESIPMTDLPDHFCDPDLLQDCVDEGWIEFGQQCDEITCSAG